MRRANQVRLVVAAVATGSAVAVAALAGQDDEWSSVLRASLSTPSGRSGTFVVRPVHRRDATWCATLEADTGHSHGAPTTASTCGSSPGLPPGLHGTMTADCAAGEVLAFGDVARRLRVFQPSKDGPANHAVTVVPPAGFDGRFFAVVVDLSEPWPRLVAADEDGTVRATADFKRVARECRSAMSVFGGF
jgi:hypothetical protein